MSWPLANHNWKVRATSEGSPPSNGTVETLLDINTTPRYWGSRLKIVTSPNGKVMVNAGGARNSSLFYSSNSGATWTEKSWTFLPEEFDSNQHYINGMAYNQSLDRWYIATLYDPTRVNRYYYSDDDGTSWTAFTIGSLANYGAGIFVDDDGAIVAAGRGAGNNGSIAKDAVTKVIVNNSNNFGATRAGSRYVTRGTTDADLNSAYYIAEIDRPFASATATRHVVWPGNVYERTRFSMPSSVRVYMPAMAVGTTITAKTITDSADLSDPALVPTESWTFPASVKHGDIGYRSDFGFLLAARSDSISGGDRFYVYYSDDGSSWSGTALEFTVSGENIDNDQTVELAYAGSGYWLVSYVEKTSKNTIIGRIFLGSAPEFPPTNQNPLNREIVSLAPDIFYRMDDAEASTSVVDLGQKNYPNTVTQTVTFGQAGLVPDDGTAALFADGNVTASVTQGAAAHAHLFVLAHNNTASARTIMAFGQSFSLSLAADHKPRFTAGSTVVASESAIAANTATLVVVLLETVPCGTQVSLYVQGVRVAEAIISLSAPQSAPLVISGSGVTIDYYALINNRLVDVGRLQEAWGLTPTNPPAPAEARCEQASLILRANDSPQRADYYSAFAAQWLESFGFLNSANGNRDTVWPVSAGTGFHDPADSKFNGSMSIPGGSFPHIYLAPIPRWIGLPVGQIGRRDFTFSLWVKPEAYRANIFTAEVFYRRPGSDLWRRALGFSWQINGDINGSTARFSMGRSLAVARTAQSIDGSALVATFHNLPAMSLAEYRFITVSRRGNQWFASIDGKIADRASLAGDPNAPFVWDFNFVPGCYFGARSTALNGNRSLAFETTAMRMDDIVFIVGEALYTQDFTPPVAQFGI